MQGGTKVKSSYYFLLGGGGGGEQNKNKETNINFTDSCNL